MVLGVVPGVVLVILALVVQEGFYNFLHYNFFHYGFFYYSFASF